MTNYSGIRAARLVLIAGLTFAMIGCSAQYRNHGYVPSEDQLQEIVVGVDTRDTVAETVGAPSASGVLNDSGYYYVSSRVRHFAYRRPEVTERQVLAISFDQKGVVSNVERFGLEDGQVVPLSRRITDSRTTNHNFLRRLFKVFGRLDPSELLAGGSPN